MASKLVQLTLPADREEEVSPKSKGALGTGFLIVFLPFSISLRQTINIARGDNDGFSLCPSSETALVCIMSITLHLGTCYLIASLEIKH